MAGAFLYSITPCLSGATMSANALAKAPWVLVWQQLQGPSKKEPGPESQTRNTQHNLEPGIRNNAPNSETLIAKRDPSPQPSILNPKPPPKPCFPGTGSAPSVGRAVTRLPQLLPARKTQGPLGGSKRIVSFCEKREVLEVQESLRAAT